MSRGKSASARVSASCEGACPLPNSREDNDRNCLVALMFAGLALAHDVILFCAKRVFHEDSKIRHSPGSGSYWLLATTHWKHELQNAIGIIRKDLREYECRIIVGHSMGGLRSLAAVIELSKSEPEILNNLMGFTSYAIAARLRWYLMPVAIPMFLLCSIPIFGNIFAFIPLPVMLPKDRRFIGVIGRRFALIPAGALANVMSGQFYLWRNRRHLRELKIPLLFIFGLRDGLIAPARGLLKSLRLEAELINHSHDVPVGHCDAVDSDVELLWDRWQAEILKDRSQRS